MTIETAQRIKWRLEEKYKPGETMGKWDVELAIYKEAGTDDRTVTKYLKLLKKLGWIKRLTRYTYRLEKQAFDGTST